MYGNLPLDEERRTVVAWMLKLTTTQPAIHAKSNRIFQKKPKQVTGETEDMEFSGVLKKCSQNTHVGWSSNVA